MCSRAIEYSSVVFLEGLGCLLCCSQYIRRSHCLCTGVGLTIGVCLLSNLLLLLRASAADSLPGLKAGTTSTSSLLSLSILFLIFLSGSSFSRLAFSALVLRASSISCLVAGCEYCRRCAVAFTNCSSVGLVIELVAYIGLTFTNAKSLPSSFSSCSPDARRCHCALTPKLDPLMPISRFMPNSRPMSTDFSNTRS